MSESDYGVCELNGGKEGDQENLVEKPGYVFARRRKVTQLCLPPWFIFLKISSESLNFYK